MISRRRRGSIEIEVLLKSSNLCITLPRLGRLLSMKGGYDMVGRKGMMGLGDYRLKMAARSFLCLPGSSRLVGCISTSLMRGVWFSKRDILAFEVVVDRWFFGVNPQLKQTYCKQASNAISNIHQ